MTPFVIDNQIRRRYIFVFILLLFASFGLGYASGFYMGLLDKVEIHVDVETPVEQPDASTSDDQTPEANQPGEATSKPEVKSEVSPPANKEKNTAVIAPKTITKSAPSPVKPAKETEQTPEKNITAARPEVVKPVPPKPEPAKPVAAATKPSAPVAAKQPPQVKDDSPGNAEEISDSADDTTDNAQDSQRMFSVQVGVFANRENALNLVEELKTGGFDAYLDDYVASGGEVKYNVRFGREADRNLIQQQLTKYKQQFSTSAYIIINK